MWGRCIGSHGWKLLAGLWATAPMPKGVQLHPDRALVIAPENSIVPPDELVMRWVRKQPVPRAETCRREADLEDGVVLWNIAANVIGGSDLIDKRHVLDKLWGGVASSSLSGNSSSEAAAVTQLANAYVSCGMHSRAVGLQLVQLRGALARGEGEAAGRAIISLGHSLPEGDKLDLQLWNIGQQEPPPSERWLTEPDLFVPGRRLNNQSQELYCHFWRSHCRTELRAAM